MVKKEKNLRVHEASSNSTFPNNRNKQEGTQTTFDEHRELIEKRVDLFLIEKPNSPNPSDESNKQNPSQNTAGGDGLAAQATLGAVRATRAIGSALGVIKLEALWDIGGGLAESGILGLLE